MYLSNCCEAKIEMHDDNGHGKCSNCHENCTPLASGEEEQIETGEPVLGDDGNSYCSNTGRLLETEDARIYRNLPDWY